MSLLSRLFGGGGGGGKTAPPAADPVMHEGFAIYPEPVAEGGQWRLAARIVAEIDGTERIHRLIRADLLTSEDAAADAAIAKARKVIDDYGARLFD